MKVAICIASHQRPAPLNTVLRCLPPHWHAVVVVSTDADAAAVVKRPHTHVRLFPNEPLGAKWQHAISCARELDPDLVGITGSDDVMLVDEPVFRDSMDDAEFVGLNSFHIYHEQRHYKCRYTVPGHIPLGGGRFYTRALLDRMNWQVFNPTLARKLDQQGFFNARRAGARILHVEDLPGLRLVALKGDWPQLNPMEKLRIHTRTLDITPLPDLAPMGDYATT